jgi:hypothetical protein
MKKALPFAGMQDIHQYGRRLLAQKRPKEAMEVFKMNYQKNPAQFTTLMGWQEVSPRLGIIKMH